ncbi:MAG TPA: hypothetical protein VM598_13210, partial [Bdellovibrionota bacterium]|nr:hypothetical protein [Bdellovibrionota bacterium]
TQTGKIKVVARKSVTDDDKYLYEIELRIPAAPQQQPAMPPATGPAAAPVAPAETVVKNLIQIEKDPRVLLFGEETAPGATPPTAVANDPRFTISQAQ